MKNYKIALISLIIAVASGLLFAAAHANLIGDNDKETTVIKVEGMSCPYCAKTVEETISKEAGVSSVELDAVTGLATVTYDKEKTNPVKIAKNITKETYFESEVVKVESKDKSD